MPNAMDDVDELGARIMALVWRRPPADLAERTRRRVVLHLIPYLFFLYILAYLDRVNVSVAALKMHDPTSQGGMGFSPAVTGFGFGIFFWGYWILEIPSTVSVVRWGARWVFVRILILWGVCATLVGLIGTSFAASLFAWIPHLPETSLGGAAAHFINGLHANPKNQFYFLRFMLGFFEGGFFPSVIVYLSHWFRTEDRARAIASFMAAIPLASMFGMPLSGKFLSVHWLGLPGWRWIFILEGVLPIVAGFLTIFFLPDRPEHAQWLPPGEREWLSAELEREHRSKHERGHGLWVKHLGMVLLLTFVYFCLNVASYGLASVMPAVIKTHVKAAPEGLQTWLARLGDSDQVASYLTSLPFVLALLAMLANGRHSDRTHERIWHVAVPLSLWSLAIGLVALLDRVPLVPLVLMIFLVGTFMYAHLPAFWPIPSMFLGATAAASAIGFINMIGNLGGSLGAMMAGRLASGQAGYAKSLMFLAPWPLLSAAIILIVGYTHHGAPDPRPAPQPVERAGAPIGEG